MNAKEEKQEGSGSAAATSVDAGDHAEDSSRSLSADENGESQQADAATNGGDVGVNENKKEGVEGDGASQNPDTDDGAALLRDWAPMPISDDVAPTHPAIDYSNLDETPYEHNFEPGDHIIRWDMLPILWPIQIHGIVLEVSEDKSEVTICDFGFTSVKTTDADKDSLVEEENAKFTEAIQDEDECQDATNNGEPSGSTSSPSSPTKKSKKKHQRLHVIILTKWSDLKKWHKVDYEGGLLNVGKGDMGKGLKKLGKSTGKLWTSMSSSVTNAIFVKTDAASTKDKKTLRSVRYDIDDKGYCVHHPEIQLKRLKDDGDWVVVRKKCPECIMVDCPAMLGEDGLKTKGSLLDSEPSISSGPSFSSTEDEPSNSQVKQSPFVETPPEDLNKSHEMIAEGELPPSSALGESSESNSEIKSEHPSESTLENGDDKVAGDNVDPTKSDSDNVKTEEDESKTLEQMIAEANDIDKQSRKPAVKTAPTSPTSPKQSGMGDKRSSWHGSLKALSMKSISNISSHFSAKTKSVLGENAEEEEVNSEKEQPKSRDKQLPRSDPPLLVLARTRFILEHGEDILPPYHIINSNSECIAVWCKTGRWSTLQASVFLHSTAIGHAKSATALTLGVAATQPWLIPAFATVGVAAVGTPWLLLKVANDKWNEATMSLTEKFWMQAEPEVFVECIEKWGNIE